MTNTNKWHHVQTFLPYVDFDKELLAFEDEGNSSIDLRMAFDIESHTVWISTSWHNNDGNTLDLDGDKVIEWDVAIRALLADGVDLPDVLV